jgi:Zn-dependent M28 family amino/carboxypeptidase
MSHRPLRRSAAAALMAVVGISAASIGTAAASPSHKAVSLPERLTKSVTVNGVLRHERAFQRIAERNGGNRAAGRPGFTASVSYVQDRLESAGFEVTVQDFEFPYFEDQSAFEQIAPTATAYEAGAEFFAAEFSPDADVTGTLQAVDLVLPPTPEPNGSTSGCEPEDFAGFTAGNVALLQRGTCTFVIKVTNALNAGASGVVLFNEGQTGRTVAFSPSGELPGLTIPVVMTTFEIGSGFAATPDTSVRLNTKLLRETRLAQNVIAQTTTGRADNVVMAGAHLDSVTAGPGINDNGSGSSALLELAIKMGPKPKVANAVRFAWWGAEEEGLLGSNYYVENLDFEQQLDIALYLNFDMIGSPNAAYFVYDGDDSDGEGAGPGPFGSAQIEAAFVDYLETTKGIPTEGTDFSGRSDYGAFIAAGIPAGGLFTGAEGIKTAEQAAKWGGEADAPYDPCYHQACDTLGNLDRTALDANADAMAWVTASYALSTEDVNGIGDRASRAAQRTQISTQRVAQVETTGHGSIES